jgi:hypothetical protein
MLRSFSLVIFLLTLQSCQTTKSVASPKQIQLQKEFAETTAFKINSNWANPMATASMNALSNSGLIAPGSSAGRIDISQNNNHLSIEGTKVDMVLPYFGERQMGGGYNTGKTSGINYKGDIKDLSVEFNEKKKRYSISFSMSKSTESFDVTIDLFQNLTTRVNINSSHRTGISYDGVATALPEVTEND